MSTDNIFPLFLGDIEVDTINGCTFPHKNVVTLTKYGTDIKTGKLDITVLDFPNNVITNITELTLIECIVGNELFYPDVTIDYQNNIFGINFGKNFGTTNTTIKLKFQIV
jgi:hypothetical protein